MYNDSFKSRYTTIPFATHEGNHKPCGTAKSTLLHCHREMELLLLLEGEAIFLVDGREHRAVAGDVLTISPYLLHATRFPEGKGAHTLCLCFDLSLLHDRALCASLEDGSASTRSHLSHTCPETAHVADCIRAAFDAHACGHKGWEFAVVSALCTIFGELIAKDGITRRLSGADRESFCHRALSYLEAHLSENISSADAARALYLSHGHFCRTFHAQFGHTFGEYLTLLRLERAEHLLLTTDWRISRICSAVGFDSFSYFGKRFKEATGMTPSDYRRKETRGAEKILS